MKSNVFEPAVGSGGIPLCKPYLSQDEEQGVSEVLRSGWLMQGKKVAEFERLVADYVGSKHAVAVNSGTSALMLAIVAAECGSGDELIMPSHSFVATANAAVLAGAKPVFVDIGPADYVIDPSQIEARITARTRAIIVVHQIGFAADMASIMAMAEKRNLVIIEDAACSLGSTYQGRMTGSFGLAACLSFHPRKVITTGEGGMVLTDSDKLARKVRSLRNHGLAGRGSPERAACEVPGYNCRMTDIQAAIGLAQLAKLDEILRLRRLLAERYNDSVSQIRALRLPRWSRDSVPNYQSYAVEVEEASLDRDALVAFMEGKRIACRPGIQPIHLEPLYAPEHGQTRLPETLRAARHSFFLPLYPSMSEREQDFVINNLKTAVEECAFKKEAG